MSLANVSIVGNLVKEPEQHQFASGRIKTTLIVAVNSFNKVRRERSADFYRVETWDRLAELAKAYLEKGNQIGVTGRLVMDIWEDKDGRNRITPTVHASQLALPQRRYSRNEEKDKEEELAEGLLPESQPRQRLLAESAVVDSIAGESGPDSESFEAVVDTVLESAELTVLYSSSPS